MATESEVRWEHFAHGADIGIRGFGASAGIAFEQAALALTAVCTVCIEPARVACTTPVDIRCEAPDVELLLVD